MINNITIVNNSLIGCILIYLLRQSEYNFEYIVKSYPGAYTYILNNQSKIDEVNFININSRNFPSKIKYNNLITFSDDKSSLKDLYEKYIIKKNIDFSGVNSLYMYILYNQIFFENFYKLLEKHNGILKNIYNDEEIKPLIEEIDKKYNIFLQNIDKIEYNKYDNLYIYNFVDKDDVFYNLPDLNGENILIITYNKYYKFFNLRGLSKNQNLSNILNEIFDNYQIIGTYLHNYFNIYVKNIDIVEEIINIIYKKLRNV